MSKILDKTKNGYGRVADGVTYGYIRGLDAVRNARSRKGEEGNIAETILIIGIVVVIVVVVGNLLYNAITDAAESTSECITNANKVKTGNTTNC